MTGGDAPQTAEDAAQMLAALEEGETGALADGVQESSEAPDAAAEDAGSGGEDANAPAEGEAEGDTDAEPEADKGGATEATADEAVVLARDGKHTIPYAKLEEARQGAQQWRAQAEALQQQLAALKTQQQQQPPDGASADETAPDEGDGSTGAFGDFSEEALAKGINKIVNERVAVAMAAVEKRQQELAAQREYQAALKRNEEAELARYSNAVETIQSNEFAAWVGKFPKTIQTAITNTFKEGVGGTVDEMLEVLDAYTKDTQGAKPSPSPDLSAAKTAAKSAIAQAQAAPPSSLSSIPGGRVDGRDVLARLDEMSPAEQLVAFEDMTPEQVERALARAI